MHAENELVLQSLGAGGGFSSGDAVGGAVVVGVLNVSTKAFIEGDADVARTTSVLATTSLTPTKIDIPLVSENDDPTATSVAVGGAVSSGDTATAGAVIVNVFEFVTNAYIDQNANINQDAGVNGLPDQSVVVSATDHTETMNLAGGLSVTLGGSGGGASLDVGRHPQRHPRLHQRCGHRVGCGRRNRFRCFGRPDGIAHIPGQRFHRFYFCRYGVGVRVGDGHESLH